VPYAKLWPDLIDHIDIVLRVGFVPRVLVLNRDFFAMAQSQVKMKHANNMEAAYKQITAAYQIIFHAINHHKADYVMVSYESLFIRQKDYLGWLLAYLGLELQEPVERISDQNAKYYQGEFEWK
jgi:hypothetical protein